MLFRSQDTTPPDEEEPIEKNGKKEAPDDIETRLQRLEGLKEKGLLTDAEYQAKREEIIGEV